MVVNRSSKTGVVNVKRAREPGLEQECSRQPDTINVPVTSSDMRPLAIGGIVPLWSAWNTLGTHHEHIKTCP